MRRARGTPGPPRRQSSFSRVPEIAAGQRARPNEFAHALDVPILAAIFPQHGHTLAHGVPDVAAGIAASAGAWAQQLALAALDELSSELMPPVALVSLLPPPPQQKVASVLLSAPLVAYRRVATALGLSEVVLTDASLAKVIERTSLEMMQRMERDHEYTVSRVAGDLTTPEGVGSEAGRRAIARLGSRKLATRQCAVVYPARLARGLVGHFLAVILLHPCHISVMLIERLTVLLLDERHRLVVAALQRFHRFSMLVCCQRVSRFYLFHPGRVFLLHAR